jgi:soluble lytic murein transglycosylase-like protein
MPKEINLKDLPPNMQDELLNVRAIRKVKEAQQKFARQGEDWVSAIQQASLDNNVPIWQVAATIERENRNWNPTLRSSDPRSSAQGLGQMVKGTAQHLGVNPIDPIQSIHGVAKYLSELRQQLKTDDFKELTKAYVLGPGGYRQYNQTGEAKGSEQIPSVEKFLATSDLTGGDSRAMTPANPRTSQHMVSPFQEQGVQLLNQQITPSRQNKMQVNEPQSGQQLTWNEPDLDQLPELEVVI